MRPCWNPRCSQPANWCGKIHKFFHSTGNFFTKQPTPERYYKFISFIPQLWHTCGREKDSDDGVISQLGRKCWFSFWNQLTTWKLSFSTFQKWQKNYFGQSRQWGLSSFAFKVKTLYLKIWKNCNIWEAWWRNLRTAVPSNLPVTSLEGSYFHVDQIRIVQK